MQKVTQIFHLYCLAQSCYFCFRVFSLAFQLFFQVSTWHSKNEELVCSRNLLWRVFFTLFTPVLILEQFVVCFWCAAITDAAELHTGKVLHICACCPNQAILWTKGFQETTCHPFKQWFFRWKEVLTKTISTIVWGNINMCFTTANKDFH